MTEQYANKAQTTIAEDLDNSETVVTVTSDTGFPIAGSGDQYRVIVDDELMIVTAKAGVGNVDWTVTRGAEGTTAASHTNGANITCVVTAASLLALIQSSTIWDAKGDLAVGIGSNAAGRLAVGNDNDVLVAASGETTGLKWADQHLRVHLDSDSGITKDGGDLVSNWADQGINGNDVVQATGTNQPLWVDAVINSRPVVRFDGVDNYLSRGLAGSAFSKLTLIIVCRPRDASATVGIFSWAAGLGDTAPFIIIQRNSTDVRFYVNGGYQFTVAHATDATHLYVLTWDGATWTLYTDGGSGSTYSGGGSGNSTSIILGNGYAGYAFVEIPELMIYSRVLSTTERQTLETTLKSEYGIA